MVLEELVRNRAVPGTTVNTFVFVVRRSSFVVVRRSSFVSYEKVEKLKSCHCVVVVVVVVVVAVVAAAVFFFFVVVDVVVVVDVPLFELSVSFT